MKIQLNYEPSNGIITTKSGLFILSYVGLETEEIKEQSNSNTVDSAIVESLSTKSKLNTDDILKLREAGLI